MTEYRDFQKIQPGSNVEAMRINPTGNFSGEKDYVAAYYSAIARSITVSFRDRPEVTSGVYGNMQPPAARKLAMQLLKLADEMERR